jgi:gliding motility-associated-like protein
MKKMRKIVLCIALILTIVNVNAQRYELGLLNGQTITTCSGTVLNSLSCSYLNTVGNTIQSYCDGDSYTVTFYSGSASNQIQITVPKVNFETEAGKDILTIYNGPNTASPVLASLSGTLAASQRYLTTGGYVTFRFVANATNHDFSGFKILLGCKDQGICGSNPAPADDCINATPICNYSNYCTRLNGWFTADKEVELGNYCGLPNFSMENNGWLKFEASATTAVFDITTSNSDRGSLGVEAAIFQTDCNTFTKVSNCVTQGPPPVYPGIGKATLTATGLTVGGTYYIMMDGWGGAIMDITLTPKSGIDALNVSATDTSICKGENTTLSANNTVAGSTYKWKIKGTAPVIGSASTLNVSPTVTTTYICEVTQPGVFCPNQTLERTIFVDNGPNVNAGVDKTLTCTANTVALNGSSTTPGGGLNYTWSGPGITTNPSFQNITVNAVGTYILSILQNSTGCSNTDTAVVILDNTLPNVNAGTDGVRTCTNSGLVTLTGSSTTPGATFAWTTSDGNVQSGLFATTAVVNKAGTYTFTVKNPTNGCTASDVAVVTDNNTKPTADAGADVELNCANQLTGVKINGSSSGVTSPTYTWSGPVGGIISGASTATPTVIIAGNYSLTVGNPSNGCISNASTVKVNSNTTPPHVNAGTDKVLTCSVNSIALTGSSNTSGATFSWSGPGIVSGGLTATPTINKVGSYTLTVTNPANFCKSTDITNVTLDNTPPDANAGPDKTLTCSATTVTLNGSSTSSGVTYNWTGTGIVSGANTATPDVNKVGNFTLTVTKTSNGCTKTDIANVTQNITPPNANAGTDKKLTCAITSIALSGTSTTAGATFSWSGPGIVSGGATATPTVNTKGDYTLTTTSPINGCTATDIVKVTEDITAPTISASADKKLTCLITNTTFNSIVNPTGCTYSWTGPVGGISSSALIAKPTVILPGTYTVVITNPVNGCTGTTTADVLQDITPPDANAGSDATITCTNPTITLNATSNTAGATFLWTGPAGGISTGAGTFNPKVIKPGAYTVKVTNPTNGCFASDVVDIFIDTVKPNIDAGLDQVITCTTPTATIVGFSSTPNVTYGWTGTGLLTGSNSAIGTTNSVGNYTLTVTNPSNGCKNTDIAKVTQNTTQPDAKAGADKKLTCSILSTILNGSSTTSGVDYSWSGPSIVSDGNTATPTIDQGGTYTLTVTNPVNGCSNTDDVLVSYDNVFTPAIVLSSLDKDICTFESATLTATTGLANYDWYLDGNLINSTLNNSINVTDAGVYSVKSTSTSNGCEGTSNNLIVTVSSNPSVTLSAQGDPNLCEGESLTLQGDVTFLDYKWYKDNIEIPGVNTSSYSVDKPGSYTVSAANNAGCRDTSEAISVTVDLDFTFDLGADKDLCENDSITLGASVSSATYVWNTGDTNATILVKTPNEYSVVVTRGACIHEDSVNISFNAKLPVWDLGADTVLCKGKELLLLAPTDDFTTFIWEDGYNDNPKYVSLAGEYSIKVTNACGDTYDTIIVTLDTCECNVYVPNAFSPNGDAVNQFFNVKKECDNQVVTLRVYNRWGIEVYNGNDADLGWDGTYNGALQPQDSYIWTITYYHKYAKREVVEKGSVLLLR